MTILRKVIGSVVAPLLVFSYGMLPAAQADGTTENFQVQATPTVIVQEPLIRQAAASRSSVRIAFSNRVVKTGKKYIGHPYCRGGKGPNCFDCSGFTQFVYARNGIDIPRMAESQLSNLHRVSRKNAKPGDLVFFLNKRGHAYHVGIYIGNNKVMHSPKPHRRVKVERIWSKRIVFATIGQRG